MSSSDMKLHERHLTTDLATADLAQCCAIIAAHAHIGILSCTTVLFCERSLPDAYP